MTTGGMHAGWWVASAPPLVLESRVQSLKKNKIWLILFQVDCKIKILSTTQKSDLNNQI